jgi:hypothetical protein
MIKSLRQVGLSGAGGLENIYNGIIFPKTVKSVLYYVL